MLFKRIVPDLVISNAGLGTEAEKVEILSPFFFSTPRNSLVIPKLGLSLKPWGIALKFLFLHHENILFPN
ncbi:hypothetical protein AAH092_19840, partial [Bacteroides xylanisolvens]